MFKQNRTYLQLFTRAIAGPWNNNREYLSETTGSFSRYRLDQRLSFPNQIAQAKEVLKTHCLPSERKRWAIVKNGKVLFRHSDYPEDLTLPWETHR